MERWTLPKKVDQLLLKGDKKGVLFLLSKITALNNKFLADADEEYLRYVGHFRAQMLIQWGMYREALAWVCLENELYPDNLRTVALKEALKNGIHNLPKKETKEIITEPWKDVAGMYELKAIIQRDIILPLQDRQLYEKYGVKFPQGYMFYGPPGCGKTYFASKVAGRIGFNFLEIKTSDIASTYVHGTQMEVKRVFDEARAKIPVVLFFDEIDAMVPNRTRSDVSHHYMSEVNEFLGQLDRVDPKQILVIGATNYINQIDPAILRPGRFDKKIFIGPPDLTARAEGFKQFLKGFPQDQVKYDIVAELSEFYTFSDIRFVCEEIKRDAIAKRVKLNTDLICRYVTRYQPSLNEKELEKYF